MAHIQTSKTRERVNKSTVHGIHPAVAERLRAFGIDPEERATEIQSLQRGTVRQRHGAGGLALSMPGPHRGAGGGLELSLDPDDVTLVTLLNQAALETWDGTLIADSLAPVQLVSEKSAQYLIWDQDAELVEMDTRIGPRGRAKEIVSKLSDDVYACKSHALKGETLRTTARVNPSVASRARTVERVTRRLLRQREIRVAKRFHDASVYASSNKRTLTSGNSGTHWGGSGAKPIEDILTMQEAILAPVTDCVMTDLVWHAVQRNNELKTILASQFDNKGLLRPMDFSLYFGIPNVQITRTEYVDSSSGRRRIWSQNNLWLGVVTSAEDEPTFMRTFRFRQGAGGFVTATWPDEDVGDEGADWSRVSHSDDEKIVAPGYGALLINVRA